MHEHRHDLFVDFLNHLVEHFEALLTISDDGVLLTVRFEPYAAFERVHVVDMVHPLAVHDAQHDLPLDVLEIDVVLLRLVDFHLIRRDHGVVEHVDKLGQRVIFELVLGKELGLAGQKLALDLFIELLAIPLVVIDLGVGVRRDDCLDLTANDFENFLAHGHAL